MFKKFLKTIWRYPYILYNSKMLKNRENSIISYNCIGGIMYSDTKSRFLSPTINLIIINFLDFCENLEECLDNTPELVGYNEKRKCIEVEIKYSKGKIEIYPIHYKNFNDFMEAWDRRKKRVNYSKICIVSTDEYIRTEEEIRRFNNLPFKKICFTSKLIENENFIYCKEFRGERYVGDILKYCNIFGLRIFEKNFNFIEWLNSDYKKFEENI